MKKNKQWILIGSILWAGGIIIANDILWLSVILSIIGGSLIGRSIAPYIIRKLKL